MARDETYLHTKFYLDPSNRLATIHERYREIGQTGQTGQDRTDRQRSDSIGRTVLQTVAQKSIYLKRYGPVIRSVDWSQSCGRKRVHCWKDL